jgi:hypothetical protein
MRNRSSDHASGKQREEEQEIQNDRNSGDDPERQPVDPVDHCHVLCIVVPDDEDPRYQDHDQRSVRDDHEIIEEGHEFDGDSFTLYYDGMSAKFTKSFTSKMETQYGVPLDTNKGDGWMQDYKFPDCFAEKYQLVFQATDNAGNKISYDPINRLNVDSLARP